MNEPANDSNSKLLDPELNPILNPLLAAHMGRWAEVYFTTPPEKRDEAVAALVRELSGKAKSQPSVIEKRFSGSIKTDSHPQTQATEVAEIRPAELEEPIPDVSQALHLDESRRGLSEPPPETRRVESRDVELSDRSSESEPSNGVLETDDQPVVCENCGHLNGAEHKFCGMCGIVLVPPSPQRVSERPLYPAPSETPDARIFTDAHRPELISRDAKPVLANVSSAAEIPRPGYSANRAPQRAPSDAYISSFYPVGEEEIREGAPHRYRLYIALIVAALIAWLIYVAWRNNSFKSTELAPTSMPAASSAGTPSTGKAGDARTSAAPANATSDKNPDPFKRGESPATTQGSKSSNGSPRKRRPIHASSLPPPSQPASAASSANDPSQNGAEEFANAEKYLNEGTSGKQQAVQWLWKAVSKQNLPATLTLSDLYLRGDGVQKSCDQARLLLDAAARKGQSAAAIRLRNLRAYGCQ